MKKNSKRNQKDTRFYFLHCVFINNYDESIYNEFCKRNYPYGNAVWGNGLL